MTIQDESSPMTIAARLARFVTSISVDDMPPLALERAQMSIASSVASAALGQGIASVQAIRAIRERALDLVSLQEIHLQQVGAVSGAP